jgi:hypothetical protein
MIETHETQFGEYRVYVGCVDDGQCVAEVWRGAEVSGEFVGTTGVVDGEETAQLEAMQIAAKDGEEKQAWKRQQQIRCVR